MPQWIRQGRPAIHFAPQKGWINDPNGLIHDGERYHLFAQHHPHDTVWGPMHWLHAVSDDLLHWKELGIALWPDSLGTMFSGCAVIDADNSAGFGKGAMVAVFTQHGERECQSIAYALDGERFTVYEGNPVIENPGIPDFRDPKVFWHGPSGDWRMVVSAGTCIAFYRSDNLKNWEKTGEFGEGEKGEAGVYECPDLFPLAGPDGREHWVLLASIGAPPEDGGGRTIYFVGDYDGEVFRQTGDAGAMPRVDAGPDNYAGVTFSGTDERLFVGWAALPQYAGKVPAGGYRGCHTLPRRLSLRSTPKGLCLAAEPVLPALRFSPVNASGCLPGGAYALRIWAKGAFEARLTNRHSEAFCFGLNESGHFFTDRTKAGASDFDAWFTAPAYGRRSTERLLDGGLEMTLIIDHTLAELFADEGTYASTSLLFPTCPYTCLQLRGTVMAEVAEIGIR